MHSATATPTQLESVQIGIRKLYKDDMSFFAELPSWYSPPPTQLSPVPEIGSKAPSTSTSFADLSFPRTDGKAVVLTFLRHCGCPFAEDALLNLRATAAKYPSIIFYAISHSDQSSTEKWRAAIGGQDPSNLHIIVDSDRQIYAKWGLGTAGWAHVLSPTGMMAVMKLGKEKGIWNRPTESGSRWQIGGNFAVDGEGVVRWGGVSERADAVADFEKAVAAIGGFETAKM